MNLKLTEEWSGEISGTNSGDFFLQINCTKEGNLSGLLRINDPAFGLNLYRVAGQFDGKMLDLVGTPSASAPNTQLGAIRVRGNLQPDNSIKGNWESAISTGGKFSMSPHSIDTETSESTSHKTTESESSDDIHETDRKIIKFLGIEVWKIISGVVIGVLVILLAAYLIPKLGLTPLA